MEVWSGTIASAENPLRGVKLINPSPANTCKLAKSAKLSVHSLVNPNLIPLYGRTGGSLEVHISDLSTSRWLKTRLLSDFLSGKDGYSKAQPIQQCPIGVLVSVKASRNVTDILFYGVITTRTSRPGTRLTQPPVGQTQEPEAQTASTVRELRIYGIPLNSETITIAHALATPPTSPPSEEAEKKDGPYAEFLPNQRLVSPKRKRVNTLFEAATQHHRRVRRQGGEAVSQLMAGGNPRPEAARMPERGLKREASDINLHDIKAFKSENKTEAPTIGRERGRSISIASEQHPLGGTTSRDPTPSIDNLKSHHLSISNRGKKPRTSILDTSTRSTATPPPRPPSIAPERTAPEGSASKIMAENKDLLTRTILTCMRLYGYNRNSKRRDSISSHSRSSSFSGAVSTRPTTPAAAPPSGTEEDEFKTMYHATYRASTFALRRYLNPPSAPDSEASSSVPRLEKEKAMSMVDEFFKLFCQEDGH